MKRKLLLFLIAFNFFVGLSAQPQAMDFPVELEVGTLPLMPSLHSFCWAQWEGKWLIMSGRNNGLHGFQPPFAFPTANQNNTIYVVNPSQGTVSTSSLAVLPPDVVDQVSSSNLEFHQIGEHLTLIGGYGYSNVAQAYKTYGAIIDVDVPGLIQAVEAGNTIAPFFSRVADDRMAVSGGYLGHIGDTYYLAFGHRFDGRYNPFNGGSYTQTYTDEIRFFGLDYSGGLPAIVNYDAWWDTAYFHRRDYNLAPRMNSDGSVGFTGFTGVFQRNVNLPHKNSIQFGADGYTVDSSFTQLLNQYHTATMSTYSQSNAINNTLFFGGIGEYYINETGVLIQDSLVPFTKTISMISQGPSGVVEGWLPLEMSDYAGASASFIPDLTAPFNEQLVLMLDELPSGRIHVGTIVGGLISDSKNTFMQTSGVTQASNQLIEVYINSDALKAKTSDQSHVPSVFMNEAGLSLNWKKAESGKAHVALYDLSGRLVFDKQVDVQDGKCSIPIGDIGTSQTGLIYRIAAFGSISSKQLPLHIH